MLATWSLEEKCGGVQRQELRSGRRGEESLVDGGSAEPRAKKLI